MSAVSSNSRSRDVNPVQTDSSLTSSTQFVLKTPRTKRDDTHPGSVPGSTPISIGSSAMQKLQPDTDWPPKYDSTKYEQYIIQGFEHHRIFVDIDVFMKHVLHVSKVWNPGHPGVEVLQTLGGHGKRHHRPFRVVTR
ncbi:hypothetical protein BDM02DRAFT_3116822 [Thelephora ganbajun]|uniref:Uncharacterized protein n=1 Tax=Thelephora ganbajun TaxID=370292 RepID=A0ACB6ZDZ3_THEGA|nr:hypothetical protein BDM02DRAFT_3116822 [Thelephora ganbajun]